MYRDARWLNVKIVYKKDFTKVTITSLSLASVSLDRAPSLSMVLSSPDSLLLRWARKSVWFDEKGVSGF